MKWNTIKKQKNPWGSQYFKDVITRIVLWRAYSIHRKLPQRIASDSFRPPFVY